MKTLQEIIDIIKNEGEVGCTSTERYIEIYDPIFVDELFVADNITAYNLEIAQLIYLGDENVLEAYFLDPDNNGWFVDWDDLHEDTKKEILNLSIWD